MENVTKRFGKVVANNAINLELHEGEILSLLGENGSGKTTLMNMLSGIYFPDEGQIYIHGEPVTIASPKDAFEHGIGMIHQHFKLVDLFTATENIILGLEGKLDIAEASKKVKEICDKYGFDIDPNQKIYDMSVSQKQTVEIVKVLYRGADILILDEPTAVLTPQETDKLFAIMRNMKADGKSLIINGGEGLVKIIADAKYEEVLGMHIIGPRATDLIAEGALALRLEATVDELISTIHSHPTVSESVRECALNVQKRAIHIKN